MPVDNPNPETLTDNHSLHQYGSGDSPWDHSRDMAHIEQRLVIRDAESTVTDYVPHNGARFIATDSGAEYDGDGSEWSKADREYANLTVDNAPTSTTDVARGSEAIPRGPIADRPGSGDYDDQLYHATDQSVLWRWDAGESDWVIEGGTGSASQALDGIHTERTDISSPDGTTPEIGGINASAAIRGPSNQRALVLQNQDDTVVNGAGKSSIYWYAANGAQLASMVAHPAHDHWSLYTADATYDQSPGLDKSINVSAVDNAIEFKHPLFMDGEAISNTARINFDNSSSQTVSWQSAGGNLRFYDSSTSQDWFRLTDTGIEVRNATPIHGLRQVSGPVSASDLETREWAWTDSHDGSGTAAWLFKNGTGTLHYFEPTGTK